VGVASLLASAGTAYGVYTVARDLDTNAETFLSATRQDKVTQYKSLLVANALTFGVGLAGVGAGLIMIITAPKNAQEKPTDATVVPLVLTGGGGIGLSGRF
jgi:hypothetical protein